MGKKRKKDRYFPGQDDFKKELIAPPGMYRIVEVDKFPPIPEGQFVYGDYKSKGEALTLARILTEGAMKRCTGYGVATVYLVYDDKGRYLGGDSWVGE